jgi:uncharacterized OB-fold protein
VYKVTVARFWREQKNRYNLLGTKCGNCDRIFFPPKEICEDCHRKSIGKMTDMKLGGSGKIVSYTIVHDGPEAFKTQLPYTLAIIELDEGPQITAQVVPSPNKNSDSEDQINNGLKIGSRVTNIFRKISENGKSGTIHYGYKFKLVSD